VNAYLLAIIQGLTEFLPVSSSGHLAVLSHFLANKSAGAFQYTVLLHVGTLVSILVFFYKDIISFFSRRKNILNVIVVTAITAGIALVLKKRVVASFDSLTAIGAYYGICGIILLASKRISAGTKMLDQVTIRDLCIIGVMQGLAVFPGISRSGMTLVALLICRIKPSQAFSMAFVVGIPAIGGAFVDELLDTQFNRALLTDPQVIGGMLIAFVFGLAALWVLKRIVSEMKLFYFGFYCIAASLGILWYCQRCHL